MIRLVVLVALAVLSWCACWLVARAVDVEVAEIDRGGGHD